MFLQEFVEEKMKKKKKKRIKKWRKASWRNVKKSIFFCLKIFYKSDCVRTRETSMEQSQALIDFFSRVLQVSTDI